jgi:non-specific serine/threonine protein kinase
VWAIERAGAVVRLRASKGLRHLARLLAEPRREIPALELARATHGTTRQSTPADAALDVRRDADDHAGVLLDVQAKAAYRRRLADLQDELDEAERWHDGERAARTRLEIDALTQQLAAAVGLGGRDRRAAANAERARMSVSKAIRTAVRHIGEHDPELGEHLAKAVRTGTLCTYAPDPRAAIHWTVVAARTGTLPSRL